VCAKDLAQTENQAQELTLPAEDPASLKARYQALLEGHLEKLAEAPPLFGLEAYRDPGNKQVQIRVTKDLAWCLLAKAAGSVQWVLVKRLVGQALMIMAPEEGKEQQALEEILAALLEIGPTDGLQGMAAVQIIATHALAIRHLRSAAEATHPEAQNHYQRLAEKSMSMFTKQLNSLARYRSRGQPQRILIEKVEVAAGGRAVVAGKIESPRGRGGR